MVSPTGTQTEQGNLSQKRCDLKTVVFFGGVHTHIYIHTYLKLFRDTLAILSRAPNVHHLEWEVVHGSHAPETRCAPNR